MTTRVNGSRQRGMALVITLVLLVATLLISLSSMQSSRMEEAMAGNSRASDRALMAAEYGAARVVNEVFGGDISAVDAQGFINFIDEGVGTFVNINEEPGLYYTIRQEVLDPDDENEWVLNLVSVGVVTSGDVGLNGGGEYEVVAQRELEFSLRLRGIGDLAAVNPVCVGQFRKTSQAGTGGEEGEESEVDLFAKYSPAISARNLDEAKRIVAGIIYQKQPGQLTPAEINSVDNHADVVLFEGVFHASNVAVYEGSELIGVNYNKTCGNNNRMCGVKGGVSSSISPILNSPERFHDFISSIMNSSDVNFIAPNNMNLFDSSKVNVVTTRKHNVLSSSAGGLEDAPIAFSEGLLAGYSGESGGQVNDAYFDGRFYSLPGSVEIEAPDDYYLVSRQLPGSSVSGVEYFPSSQRHLGYGGVGEDGYLFELSQEGVLDVSDWLWSSSEKISYGAEGSGRGVRRDCLGCPNSASSRFDVREVFNVSLDGFYGESGFLIVDGHAVFSGNPEFEGVIIVLGEYSISGGGGKDFLGSIISFPYFYDDLRSYEGAEDREPGFYCEPVNILHAGTGSHEHQYSQRAVDRAFSLLPQDAKLKWLVGNAQGDESFVSDPSGWVERMVNKEL